MKKIIALLVIAVFAITACAPKAQATAAAQTVTQTPWIVVVTGTPFQSDVKPTATPVVLVPTAPVLNWMITAPGAPNTLPVELRDDIEYVQPPENCAQANDPNQTCSTIKGQATDADFTLKAWQGLRMTGDKIVVSQNGAPLMGFYDANTKQTMWIVVNASNSPITSLHMKAMFGSFRGFFTANWDVSKVEHMLGLGLYQFITSNNPLPTPAPIGPTPVWNCESATACEIANVNVAIWTGSEWIKTVGYYAEGQFPYWQQK